MSVGGNLVLLPPEIASAPEDAALRKKLKQILERVGDSRLSSTAQPTSRLQLGKPDNTSSAMHSLATNE